MPVNLNSGKLALLVVAVVLTPPIFYCKFYLSGPGVVSRLVGVKMSTFKAFEEEVPVDLEAKQKSVVAEEGYADVNVSVVSSGTSRVGGVARSGRLCGCCEVCYKGESSVLLSPWQQVHIYQFQSRKSRVSLTA